MTRIVIGQMQKRGKGAIVNMSSGSEFQPLPLMTVYAATKVYIKSFSEALRTEYSRFGLTIQHLTPFFVNTKMNAYSDRLQVNRRETRGEKTDRLIDNDYNCLTTLQVSSIFVPNAITYSKNAITTLGKMDSSTGYWGHGIQKIITLIAPVQIRMKIGWIINKSFRQDYFKQKRST